jgi:hypothetical protein
MRVAPSLFGAHPPVLHRAAHGQYRGAKQSQHDDSSSDPTRDDQE